MTILTTLLYEDPQNNHQSTAKSVFSAFFLDDPPRHDIILLIPW